MVELTKKGIKLVDTVLPDHIKNEERILADLTAAEKKQLAALLRKLVMAHAPEPDSSGPGK